jgi:hypothetical protein
MPECICCKKNDGRIEVYGNAIFYICGQSNCISPKGENISEWFLQGSKDNNQDGNWACYVEGKQYLEFKISNKVYRISTDKRVLKGLKNKLREIAMKESGIETDNPDPEMD